MKKKDGIKERPPNGGLYRKISRLFAGAGRVLHHQTIRGATPFCNLRALIAASASNG
jgi:hypothetical protein